jgi:glycosyltransferase involved in cell wall biosynthesis
MHLGLPVVALATTEVPQAVPPEAGIVTNRIDDVASGLRRLLAEPEEARVMGNAAREAALSRYGLNRFLADWDRVLGEVRR